MKRFIWPLLLAAVLPLAGARAVHAESTAATYLVPPVLSHPVSPIYPPAAELQEDEAWMVLHMRVKADGTPDDIKIIDGFYSRPFQEALLAAVQKWRFDPATENGKPVDWDDLQMNFTFLFADLPGAAHPVFMTNYNKANAQLKKQDYAGAKAAIEAILAKNQVRVLYEYAFAEFGLAQANYGLHDYRAALKAIRRATPDMNFQQREPQQPQLGSRISTLVQLPTNGLLPDEALISALRLRFILEANLGQYPDALETYDRVAKIKPIGADDEFAKQVTLIKSALASPEPLGIDGKIVDGSWEFRPTRRTFTVAQVKGGTLSELDVTCQLRMATLPYQDNVEWSLPEKWGECKIAIMGTEGTEFTAVQFATPATAPPSANAPPAAASGTP